MRPPQHWPHGRDPRWPWQRGTGSESHRSAAKPSPHGQILSFLRGVPLEQVSRHAVVYMDASTTGWGATFNGLVGGLDGSPTALAHQLPSVAGSTPLSRGTYEASTCWFARTILRPLRTSTDKVVYAPVACRNSPATFSGSPVPAPALAKVVLDNYPGKSAAVRLSCSLPDYRHSLPLPPSLASVALNCQPDKRVCDQRREWLQDRMAACRTWITSPVAKSCVYGVSALVADVFFLFSHCTPQGA